MIGPMEWHKQNATTALTSAVYYAYSCDVPGDVAEFGTMTAHTATSLARALTEYETHKPHWLKERKQLHLFDSFEGLPEGNEVDQRSPHVQSGMWGPNTCKRYSPEQLLEKVTEHLPHERVSIYKGWFSETLPTFDRKLSVIHVDSDLYSSAMDVLTSLFGRGLVSHGAMVLFDDWNCNLARPDLGERRAWRECVAKYAITYSDEGSYGFMSHRFIVHSYKW